MRESVHLVCLHFRLRASSWVVGKNAGLRFEAIGRRAIQSLLEELLRTDRELAFFRLVTNVGRDERLADLFQFNFWRSPRFEVDRSLESPNHLLSRPAVFLAQNLSDFGWVEGSTLRIGFKI